MRSMIIVGFNEDLGSCSLLFTINDSTISAADERTLNKTLSGNLDIATKFFSQEDRTSITVIIKIDETPKPFYISDLEYVKLKQFVLWEKNNALDFDYVRRRKERIVSLSCCEI